MKSLLLLAASLFIIIFATTVQAQSQQSILNRIASFQASGSSFLLEDESVLNDANSYQALAASTTASLLQGENKNDDYIKNLYVVSCIYYATFDVMNSILDEYYYVDDVMGLGWTIHDNWVSTHDYCSWFGIQCLDDNRITSIELVDNNLLGTWPAEVGLIGDSLEVLDLSDNYFMHHLPNNYAWFGEMDQLTELWFGHTSWEADGVPTALNQLVNLETLDCSASYWTNGPLRGDAFENLDQLRYIDIGNNSYNHVTQNNSIPPSIRQLPNLIRFYMDRVTFLNARLEVVPIRLDFLSDMDAIIEAWFDHTVFDGGLPDVLPSTLKSFSVLGCGLTGSLLSLVSNPDLDWSRMWLSGNRFEGAIPTTLGDKFSCSSNRPCWIYLEGNPGLTGTVPSSFCNQDNFNHLGADEEQCDDSSSCSCTCVGLACDNFGEDGYPVFAETSAPAPAPPAAGGFCFSVDTMVELKDGSVKKMKDLQMFDSVLVSSSNTKNEYEAIYGFGHFDTTTTSSKVEFLRIHTTSNQKPPLELTPNHMVFLSDQSKNKPVPAASLKVGDKLLSSSEEEEEAVVVVKSIQTIRKHGAIAPYTASGTIVTNGIQSSCFATVDNYDNSKIILGKSGGRNYELPLSSFLTYHELGLLFESPRRLLCHHFSKNMCQQLETYNDQGMSKWVDLPLQWYNSLILNNSMMMMSIPLFGMAFVVFGMFHLLEMMMLHPVSLLLLPLTIASLFLRNVRSKALNKSL